MWLSVVFRPKTLGLEYMLLLLRFLRFLRFFLKIQKNATFYVFLLCFTRFLELWFCRYLSVLTITFLYKIRSFFCSKSILVPLLNVCSVGTSTADFCSHYSTLSRHQWILMNCRLDSVERRRNRLCVQQVDRRDFFVDAARNLLQKVVCNLSTSTIHCSCTAARCSPWTGPIAIL